MIKVYFDSGYHSELAATFMCEETYMACLPALEKVAKEHRMTVSEVVCEDEDDNDN